MLGSLRKRLHLVLERRNFSRRLELDFIFSHLERLRRGPGTIGLDIACGLGTHTTEFAGLQRGTVVGLDMDPEVVRMAVLQRRPGALEFSVGNSQELPFAAASFDFATSVCSFEHFLDDRRAFSEAARVLRPDGWLFVTVDSLTHPAVTEAFRSRHRVACRVAQYYTAEDLRRRLQEAGFEVADVRYLVRGRLASLLTRLGLANDYGKVYLLLSAILTPFVRLEELMTSKAYGYKLGAAARRRGVLTTSS